MTVAPTRGSFWPDAVYCFGGIVGLYVATEVKKIFDSAGVTYNGAFQAEVHGRLPRKLQGKSPPVYYYIKPKVGANFDFANTGVEVQWKCPSCGRVKIGSEAVAKYAFIEGTWNNVDIFCTDLSPVAYFCSPRVIELASLHRWTNFRFVPLDQAHHAGHQGVKYLKF